jgi:tetratricopeptide (TPR) repeat protein/transcriptional regulator with XRE-family HTH domain
MGSSDLTSPFRQARIDAGMTQAQLVEAYADTARLLGIGGTVTERTIARWESPKPGCPSPSAQKVIEALFGTALEDLGFEVPPHRRTRRAIPSQTGVDRRAFLADTAAVAVAASLAGGETRRVDAGDVRALQDDTEQVFVVDHARGGAEADALAASLLDRTALLLNQGSYLPAIGHRLQMLAAAVHSHRAWLNRDAGDLVAARTHCLEALAAARLLGDRDTEAGALANLVLITIAQGRFWEARAAADAAFAAAGRGAAPTLQAMLSARIAGAAGAAGDLDGARRALVAATGHLERAGTDSPPRFARFFGPAEMDQATAAYYLDAGRPDRAVPYLQATVRGLGDGYARNAAAYRVKLSAALLAAGEVEQACAEAEQVADWVDGTGSVKTVRRLRAVRDRLAAVDSSSARATVERIDEVLGAA